MIVKSHVRLAGVVTLPIRFRKGVFKVALGGAGAPRGIPWGSMGVPGASLGGSDVSLCVAVCATDRFVACTTEIQDVIDKL